MTNATCRGMGPSETIKMSSEVSHANTRWTTTDTRPEDGAGCLRVFMLRCRLCIVPVDYVCCMSSRCMDSATRGVEPRAAVLPSSPDISDKVTGRRSPTDGVSNMTSKHHSALFLHSTLVIPSHHTINITMIRRKVSNGLLRAATQVQSASGSAASTGASVAHAVHASPMQQQTANLASSVLLSSQRNWKGETVNTLKSELKKRGLSQSGNK